jgi:hypothetical protein
MVMTLLILFGLSIYTLVLSGSSIMTHIEKEKVAQIEARTAGSYVNVRLRQFDVADSVVVTNNPLNENNSILLKSRNPTMPELDYDMWIFFFFFLLQEVLSIADAEPIWEASNNIAQIDDFIVEQIGDYIIYTIHYSYGIETRKVEKRLDKAILLRSQQYSR